MTISKQELALLFKFYQRAQQFSGGGIYGDSVIDHISFTDEMRASLLLGRLKSAGLVEIRGSGNQSRSVFGVSDKGEKFIEELMDSDPSALDAAVILLSGEEASEAPAPTVGEIREEEPEWSPLPIDRSEPEYQDAVAAMGNAIEAVQGDNGYAVTHPVERADVVVRLKGALEILKDAPAFTASSIQVYVIWPMQRLATRFTPETLTGVALKLAWDTFSTWVKKRGGSILDGIFQ